jgi:hypothetical protein
MTPVTKIRYEEKSFSTYMAKFTSKCKLKMIKALMESLNLIKCEIVEDTLIINEY